MVSGIGSAANAVPGPIQVGPLHYKCTFPLIGSQPVDVTVKSTLPDFTKGGTYSLPITAISSVSLDSAKGMWAAKGYTLEGEATATAKLYTPEFPDGYDVTTNVTLEKKAFTTPPTAAGGSNVLFPPAEPTSGFDISASGTSPTVTVTQGGWAQINVENLKLKLTPKDHAGNITSLGTFDSDCWLVAGQNNVLGQAYITDGNDPGPAPTPKVTTTAQGVEATDASGLPVVHSGTASPLVFRCLGFPIIGDQDIPVDMGVDYPKTFDTNTRARPLSIDVDTHISQAVADGLATLGARFMQVTAISNNTMKTPDFPEVRAQTTANLAKTAVPWDEVNEVSAPFELLGKANAPALVFQKPGDGSVVIGDVPPAATTKPDLILNISLFKADGTTPTDTFSKMRRNCFLSAGSIGVTLNTWKVNQGVPVGQKPGPVTGLDGTTTETTADLTWTAPTTGDPAKSYDVSYNGGPTVNVTGTSAHITGLTASTKYTFSVVAKNDTGSSTAVTKELTTKDAAVPVPDPVTGLDGTTTATTAELTWTASAGATSYDVIKGSEDPINVTATKATFTNLTPDTDYTFKVIAKNASGPSAPVTKVLHTKGEAPAPVTGLDGTTTDKTADLTWTASAGATSYDVSYNGGPTVNVTVPSAHITGLTPETTYTFSVVAKNAVGSAAAATKDLTTTKTPETKPDTVTGLDGTTTDTTADLTWTAAPRATSYDVSYNGGPTVNVTVPSAHITGLTPETTYTFSVVAKNSAGSAAAATKDLTTTKAPLTKPDPVTNLAGTPDTTKVDLTWTASALATSYDVSYNGGPTTNVTEPKATVSGLTPNTPYTFSVVAKNDAGSSAAATLEKSTLPLPAQQLDAPVIKVDDDGSFTPTFTWDKVDRATGYQVFKDGVQVGSPTDTTFKSAALAYGGTYKFTVKAVDANPAETSKASNEIPVTPKDTTKPTAPVLSENGVTYQSVALKWTASTDTQSGIAGYDVYKGATKVNTTLVTDLNLLVNSGILPETDYTFTVKAVDKAGNVSDPSNTLSVHTPKKPETADFTYNLTGSSKIKAANGTVPLKGSIKGKIDPTGKYAADLSLDKTTGNFSIFGILPVTADVFYVQQGQTTGALTGSTLTSNSKMLVKLPSIKVFGFEIAGGTACQTKSPIDVNLKSSDFKVGTGGALSGSYTLPAIDGCGLLTPIVSALVAGPDNTINLTLKP